MKYFGLPYCKTSSAELDRVIESINRDKEHIFKTKRDVVVEIIRRLKKRGWYIDCSQVYHIGEFIKQKPLGRLHAV